MTKTNTPTTKNIVFETTAGHNYKLNEITNFPKKFLEFFNCESINNLLNLDVNEIKLPDSLKKTISNEELINKNYNSVLDFITGNTNSEYFSHGTINNKIILTESGTKFIYEQLNKKENQKIRITDFLGPTIHTGDLIYSKIKSFVKQFYKAEEEAQLDKKGKFIEGIIREGEYTNTAILTRVGEEYLVSQLRSIDNIKKQIYEKTENNLEKITEKTEITAEGKYNSRLEQKPLEISIPTRKKSRVIDFTKRTRTINIPTKIYTKLKKNSERKKGELKITLDSEEPTYEDLVRAEIEAEKYLEKPNEVFDDIYVESQEIELVPLEDLYSASEDF